MIGTREKLNKMIGDSCRLGEEFSTLRKPRREEVSGGPMDLESLKSIWKTHLPTVDLDKGSILQTYRPSFEARNEQDQEPPNADVTFESTKVGASSLEIDAGEEQTHADSRTGTMESLGSEEWRQSLTHADERYKIHEEIARGGMGVVFKAQQESLQRQVAMKRLRDEKSKRSHKRSFVSEAVVTARLEHPNIVPVYDLALRDEDQLILAMKEVKGLSWHSFLKDQGALSKLDENLDILLNVCNAVAFAHSKDIVHCDLKPENVMVGDFGEVYVMDWGIALNVGKRAEGYGTHRSAVCSPCGTPGYMAPELASGDGSAIGPPTDVYLLGAILFEILTGRVLHEGDTLMKVLYKACESRPPELPSSIPEELREICAKAVQKEPKDRFQTVTEFQKALTSFKQHRESRLIIEAAQRQLESARERQDKALSVHERSRLYNDFTESVAGFRQGQLLWPENLDAQAGEKTARLGFARAALNFGDIVLAETQCTMVAAGDGEREALQTAIDQRRATLAGKKKTAKRIRLFALGLTIATVLGLIVGLAMVDSARQESDNQRRLVEQQRQLAEQQRALAQKNAERAKNREKIARETLEGLVGEVQGTLQEIPGLRARVARSDILEVAFKGLKKLYGSENELANMTEAKARLSLGELFKDVGRTDEALEELQRSIAIFRRLRPKTEGTELLRLLSEAILSTAKLYVERDELEKSVPYFEEAIELRRLCMAQGKGELYFSGLLMHALLSYSNVNQQLGKMKESKALIDETLKIGGKDLKKNPDHAMLIHSYLGALIEQAFHCHITEGAAKALAYFEEAKEYGERLRKRYPNHLLLVENLLRLVEGISSAQKELGQLTAARKNIELAYKHSKKLVELDPYRFTSKARLSSSCIILANVCSNSGDYERAGKLFKESRDTLKAMMLSDPDNKLVQGDLAVATDGLADLYIKQGQFQLAIFTLDEGLENARALSAHTDNVIQKSLLGRFLIKMGRSYRRMKNLSRAKKCLLEAKNFSKSLLGNSEVTELADLYADALEELANVQRDLKDHKNAEELILESIKIDRKLFKAEPKNSRRAVSLAGKLESMNISSLRQGKIKEAIEYGREMVTILEPFAKVDQSDTNRRHDLGTAYYRLGHGLRLAKDKECLEVLKKAQDTLKAAMKANPGRLQTRRQLSLSYYVRGAYLLEFGQLLDGYKELWWAAKNHEKLVEIATEKSLYQNELTVFQRNEKKIADHLKSLGVRLPKMDEEK